MMLFRSEEDAEGWSMRARRPRGATIPIGRLESLAGVWYGDRLDADWHPRSVHEYQAVLTESGLTGDFWRLA